MRRLFVAMCCDLCCDLCCVRCRVVRMWVRILAVTMVFVSFNKTLHHNCYSLPRTTAHPGFCLGEAQRKCYSHKSTRPSMYMYVCNFGLYVCIICMDGSSHYELGNLPWRGINAKLAKANLTHTQTLVYRL